MRKIYPSLFNKFAVFILYGLLSVAVIALAQDGKGGKGGQVPDAGPPSGPLPTPTPGAKSPDINPNNICTLNPIPKGNVSIIGYVQYSPNDQNVQSVNPNDIQWDHYNYINVIAYPKMNTPWNSIVPQKNNDGTLLDAFIGPLKEFVDIGKSKSANKTKILLSIRNFDPSTWPDYKGGDGGYDSIAGDTAKVISQSGLDGVDIEYPGMRGRHCPPAPPGSLWMDSRDGGFVDFITTLRGQIGEKTLMLTVGSDVIISDQLKDLDIDYLNIETYHYSFYDNFKNPPSDTDVSSNPNGPLNAYETARSLWTGKTKLNSDRFIMGVDLGNTLQVVNNASIKNDQTRIVSTDIQYSFGGLVKINFCPGGDKLYLYLYPWNKLSQEILPSTSSCSNSVTWTRKFIDDDAKTPWLYKQDPVTPNDYDYLSYEDFVSINRKLEFVVNNFIGGISISDISYDSAIDQYSLVDYILKEINNPSAQPPNPTSDGGEIPGTSATNAENPSNSGVIPTNTSQNKDNRGKIVGGVIGGIVGVAFIAGAGFLWYRNKQKQQNLYDNKNFNYPHITDQGNPGMVPEGSPRVVPPTTVIPIASGYVTAMFDFEGKEENDLSFKKGDKIEVLERGDGPNDWWVGRVNGTVGEFPGNYVRE